MAKIAIIINIIFGLLILGTQIWMNIKLKFAKTQEEAMNHAKTIIINLVFVVFSGGSVYLLGNELSSPTPLDKLSIARILLLSFTLAGVNFIWFMLGIMAILKGLLNLHKFHMAECHNCAECKTKKIEMHNNNINADRA